MDGIVLHHFNMQFQPFHPHLWIPWRKQAVLDVGDLVLRKDSTPSAAGGATPVDATALGSEVFQALQVTASEAWGEGIWASCLGEKGGFLLDETTGMKNH